MSVIPNHRRLVVPPAESGGVQVSFNASPDHDATDSLTGDSLVASYEIWVYDALTDTLEGAESLGKPTPSGGVITVTDSALLNSLAAGEYLVRVVALGPHADVAPDQVALSYPMALTV